MAAFASSNLGDSSPNLQGATCQDTGKPCEPFSNTCEDGTTLNCYALGPGEDMFDSCRIIAERQFKKAEVLRELFVEGFVVRILRRCNIELTIREGVWIF